MTLVQHLDRSLIAALVDIAPESNFSFGHETNILYYISQIDKNQYILPQQIEVLWVQAMLETTMRCELCGGLWHNSSKCQSWPIFINVFAKNPEIKSALGYVRHQMISNCTLSRNKAMGGKSIGLKNGRLQGTTKKDKNQPAINEWWVTEGYARYKKVMDQIEAADKKIALDDMPIDCNKQQRKAIVRSRRKKAEQAAKQQQAVAAQANELQKIGQQVLVQPQQPPAGLDQTSINQYYSGGMHKFYNQGEEEENDDEQILGNYIQNFQVSQNPQEVAPTFQTTDQEIAEALQNKEYLRIQHQRDANQIQEYKMKRKQEKEANNTADVNMEKEEEEEDDDDDDDVLSSRSKTSSKSAFLTPSKNIIQKKIKKATVSRGTKLSTLNISTLSKGGYKPIQRGKKGALNKTKLELVAEDDHDKHEDDTDEAQFQSFMAGKLQSQGLSLKDRQAPQVIERQPQKNNDQQILQILADYEDGKFQPDKREEAKRPDDDRLLVQAQVNQEYVDDQAQLADYLESDDEQEYGIQALDIQGKVKHQQNIIAKR